MRAGPEFDDDDLKRLPTAQQSVAVTQVTPTSEVIGAPGTLGVLTDQVGAAAWLVGRAAEAGADSASPPPRRLAATSAGTRMRDMVGHDVTAKASRRLWCSLARS